MRTQTLNPKPLHQRRSRLGSAGQKRRPLGRRFRALLALFVALTGQACASSRRIYICTCATRSRGRKGSTPIGDPPSLTAPTPPSLRCTPHPPPFLLSSSRGAGKKGARAGVASCPTITLHCVGLVAPGRRCGGGAGARWQGLRTRGEGCSSPPWPWSGAAPACTGRSPGSAHQLLDYYQA